MESLSITCHLHVTRFVLYRCLKTKWLSLFEKRIFFFAEPSNSNVKCVYEKMYKVSFWKLDTESNSHSFRVTGDLPGSLDLTWQVSEGDKMPGGLNKNTPVIPSSAELSWRHWYAEEFSEIPFSNRPLELCKHASHVGEGDIKSNKTTLLKYCLYIFKEVLFIFTLSCEH